MESHSHFNELLEVFEKYKVRYLIVGGYAVMLYTEPRWTKKLDIWVEPTKENSEQVYRSLLEFGAPLQGCSAADFQKEGMVYQMGAPPLRVDIIMSLEALTFDAAWAGRREAELFGRQVAFLGPDDLLRNKRAVGRHIDLHDAASLEQIVRKHRPK